MATTKKSTSKKKQISNLKEGVILGNYELINFLGKGAVGEVWKARDTKDDEFVALKIAPINSTLFYEAHTRRQLGDIDGLYNTKGKEQVNEEYDIKYFPMELYEMTLQDYYDKYPKKITIEFIYGLGASLIITLYEIHEKGYIFRDLNLGNIMCRKKKWYLIDVGEMISITTPPTKFNGTAAFASIAALTNQKPHPYDDLESLGYIMLYLVNGELPWSNVKMLKTAKFFKELGENRKEQTYELLEELSETNDEIEGLKKYFDFLFKAKRDKISIKVYQKLIDILEEYY